MAIAKAKGVPCCVSMDGTNIAFLRQKVCHNFDESRAHRSARERNPADGLAELDLPISKILT